MRFSIAFLVAVGVGCGGMTEEEFGEEYWSIACDQAFDCTTDEEIEAAGDFWIFGADAAECNAMLDDAEETEDEEACEFDADAAASCLEGMEALSCEDAAAGETVDSCATVCG